MAKIKRILKKNETPIVVLTALIFIYLIFFFNQKLNFFLGNEMIIYLDSSSNFIATHYGDTNPVEFNISIGNVAYCRAHCSYQFVDKGSNSVIDSNGFDIGIAQTIRKSYNISVKRSGSGQDIYAFELKCTGIKSILCRTKGAEKSRSQLITVNYDLSEAEKKLKNILKQNVSSFLYLLADVDIEHQKIRQKYFELGQKTNLNSLAALKIKSDSEHDSLVVSAENLRSIWGVEDYNKLDSIFNMSYFDDISDLQYSISELIAGIDEVVDKHNGVIERLNLLYLDNYNLDRFAQSLESEEILYDAFSGRRMLDKIASDLLNNTFKDYDEIAEAISNASNYSSWLAAKSKYTASQLFFEVGHALKLNDDILCSLQENCSLTPYDIFPKAQEFTEKYPFIGLDESCASINELESAYENERNYALSEIGAKKIIFDGSAENISIEFMNNELRKLNNSYFDYLKQAKNENKTSKEILELASSLLPKEKVELSIIDYDESVNLSLYLLSKTNISTKLNSLKAKCKQMDHSLNPVVMENVSAEINYSISSRINTNLSDNPPLCCLFGECSRCCSDKSCRNDPNTYPVIFLHGHSFAKGNSPEFSLDAFNKLQDKLQEDGYLSAGIVSLYSANEPAEDGAWGLSGRPVTVKASYYYDAYSKGDKYIVVPTKSENLDTYAVRFREIIGIVKQRTGKDKVNIIAHSMGGLVARRYIQIFGDSEIDKLIMIATPNHGITGSAASYCGIIGENRECQDMLKNSLFLNKLNDPLKQSQNVKISSIIGTGCVTDGKDSDGVVLAADAKLENSTLYYVKGSCGGFFGKTMHTLILNIEKYPETYNFVKEILKK